MAALGHKNVSGFDVPVNDSFRVGSIERVRNIDGQRENQLGFHRSASNTVLQRQSIQELHGDERLLATLADVVNRADVRMVEGGGRTSFTSETLQRLRVSGDVVRQELECNETA